MTDTEILDWIDSHRKGGRFFAFTGDYGVTVQSARHAAEKGHKGVREAVICAAKKPQETTGADSGAAA